VGIGRHIKHNPTESAIPHVPSVDSTPIGILRRQVLAHLPVGSNRQPMHQNEIQQEESIAHSATIGISMGTNEAAERSAQQPDNFTEVRQ